MLIFSFFLTFLKFSIGVDDEFIEPLLVDLGLIPVDIVLGLSVEVSKFLYAAALHGNN